MKRLEKVQGRADTKVVFLRNKPFLLDQGGASQIFNKMNIWTEPKLISLLGKKDTNILFFFFFFIIKKKYNFNDKKLRK